MLRSDQKKWLEHLSDSDRIVIKPWDSSCDEKYEKVKKRIKDNLGKDVLVVHCGATALKISGQDEIDVYVPVEPKYFNEYLNPLSEMFGKPRSHYPLERARFTTEIEGKHVDVFLINKECRGWIDGQRFEKYLREHPKTLEEYRLLKEEGNGLSTREYYRRKIEFINRVLELTN